MSASPKQDPDMAVLVGERFGRTGQVEVRAVQ
jgi:hypothetical protein